MSSVQPPFSHPGPAALHPEIPDGVEPPPPEPAAERHGLGAIPVWASFAVLLATLIVSGLVSVLIAVIAGATGPEQDTPPGVLIAGTVVQHLSLIAFSFVFAQLWISPIRPSTLGIRGTPALAAVGWAAAAYASFWLFAAIYVAVLGSGPEQDLVEELRKEESLVVLIGFGVLVTLMAPVAEEVFFRGFLFGVLRERIGGVWAAIVAGAVFGLAHAVGSPLRTLGILVVLGVAFCLLYWKTGSLLPGMALHALHNSISFGATKGLVWWAFLALMVGAVGLVLAIGKLVIEWERRRLA